MKTLVRGMIFALLFLLVGCPGKSIPVKQPEAPIVAGTKVDVAVREKCVVELPPEPAWKVDALPADASLFEQAKAILAEIPQRIDYENKVKAAATKCN